MSNLTPPLLQSFHNTPLPARDPPMLQKRYIQVAITSSSVGVLAVLGEAGTPHRPGRHHALRRARHVTQLGGGGSRTQAKLPINWSRN